jgi:surface protein
MFADSYVFNQDISKWNTSKVTDMSQMFYYARYFNQNLSQWDITTVAQGDSTLRSMFDESRLSTYNYNAILDGRSRQQFPTSGTSKPVLGAQRIRYGGCETNTQEGKDGRIRMESRGRTFTDGGLASCPIKGSVSYSPEKTTTTSGNVTVTVTLNGTLLTTTGRTASGTNQYFKIYTDNSNETLLVHDGSELGMVEIQVDHIDRSTLSGDQSDFVMTWRTRVSDEDIIIPTQGGGYHFTIDWGDGAKEVYTGTPGNVIHTYKNLGNYKIRIAGDFPRIYLYATPIANTAKLRSIDQWGTLAWSSMERAFYGAINLSILATDTPHLSQVTNMSGMFYGATNLTGNFS